MRREGFFPNEKEVLLPKFYLEAIVWPNENNLDNCKVDKGFMGSPDSILSVRKLDKFSGREATSNWSAPLERDHAIGVCMMMSPMWNFCTSFEQIWAIRM